VEAKSSCARAGSKTLASNSRARVFQVGRTEKRLYVCRRSTGRRRLLARRYEDITESASYANVRLAGSYVAWSYSETDIGCKAACPPDYEPTRRGIAVQDSRGGRRRVLPGAVPVGNDLVLGRSGAVAWITDVPSGGREVRAFDRRGQLVLDRGAISARSLRIEITIVSWVRDGVERFARLR
jgi:hypothetical protein